MSAAMLPLDRFAASTSDGLKPGQLFFPASAERKAPWLSFELAGELHVIGLGVIFGSRFPIGLARKVGSEVVLVADSFRAEADQASLYTFAEGWPVPGDLFVSPGSMGLFTQWSSASTCVDFSGAGIATDRNGYPGFAAFRKWRLVMDLRTPGETMELAAWERRV